MKRVQDYSDKELLAFTDEQLAKLIEIECMVEGVDPVDPPGEEPTFGEELKTKNFYKMSSNLLFPSIEAANEASRLATHEMEYTTHNGVYSAKVKKVDSISVETYYDYAELSAVKADKESFDKVHTQWGNRERAYNDYCKKRNKAELAVYDVINAARESLGEELKRTAQYQRYLVLAEDAAIAGRFFTDMLTKQGWDEEAVAKELERVTVENK